MADAPEDTIDAAESRGVWSSADPTLAPEPGGSSGTDRSPDLDLGRGAVVGRYVVLERLGVGAMGVVLSAYDLELDRKVATDPPTARLSPQ